MDVSSLSQAGSVVDGFGAGRIECVFGLVLDWTSRVSHLVRSPTLKTLKVSL